jgi:hypothetical protein
MQNLVRHLPTQSSCWDEAIFLMIPGTSCPAVFGHLERVTRGDLCPEGGYRAQPREAQNDLVVGAKLYERRGTGLGEYFFSAKTSVASTRTISDCARARFSRPRPSGRSAFAVRRYAPTPIRPYADTPLRRYAPTPIRPYAETPLRPLISCWQTLAALFICRRFAVQPRSVVVCL